jgi:hypothetical protein
MPSGVEAMRHARALLHRRLRSTGENYSIEEARQVAIRTSKGWRTKREDLFGVFDLLAVECDYTWHAIQVTTWTGGGGVSYRRNKVQKWIHRTFGNPLRVSARAAANIYIYVWAWVEEQQHFRQWRWDWGTVAWAETAPLESILKPRRRARQAEPAAP